MANLNGGQLAAPGVAAPQPVAAAPAATHTPADLAQACSEGHAAGVQAERERTGAILGHERAGAHLGVALTCINTGLSADQAGQILAALPVAQQAAAAAAATAAAPNQFAAVMASIGNPAVSGVEARTNAGTPDAASLAAQVLQSFHGARGSVRT